MVKQGDIQLAGASGGDWEIKDGAGAGLEFITSQSKGILCVVQSQRQDG